MKSAGVRPDWAELIRRAWHWTGTPPHVLRDDVGLPELALANDNDFDTPRPPPGAETVSDDFDAVGFLLAKRSQTWAQRLAEARNKYR